MARAQAPSVEVKGAPVMGVGAALGAGMRPAQGWELPNFMLPSSSGNEIWGHWAMEEAVGDIVSSWGDSVMLTLPPGSNGISLSTTGVCSQDANLISYTSAPTSEIRIRNCLPRKQPQGPESPREPVHSPHLGRSGRESCKGLVFLGLTSRQQQSRSIET